MSRKKRQPGRRHWRRALLGLGVLLVVAYFSRNYLAASVIRHQGSRLTGTKVGVEEVRLALFSGTIEIRQLTVGNPAGYTAANALICPRIYLRFSPRSTLRERLLIKEIRIEEPLVRYEESGTSNNLAELQEAMTRAGGRQDDWLQRQVQIDSFTLRGTTIQLLSSLPGDPRRELFLGPVELRGLGRTEPLGETIQIISAAVALELAKSMSLLDKTKQILRDNVGGVTAGVLGLLNDVWDLFSRTERPGSQLPENRQQMPTTDRTRDF